MQNLSCGNSHGSVLLGQQYSGTLPSYSSVPFKVYISAPHKPSRTEQHPLLTHGVRKGANGDIWSVTRGWACWGPNRKEEQDQRGPDQQCSPTGRENTSEVSPLLFPSRSCIPINQHSGISPWSAPRLPRHPPDALSMTGAIRSLANNSSASFPLLPSFC